ncbi:MAG: enoyl-CoA hydratase-related protein [Candidatus Thermoplasmatota archaeon]|jgi:enoyl-CoA hydratase|nr:enoyl-CoA hydratase-related protein [Candidatus Thermoplasmatota archaeon]MDP7264963.1 enoyl-CoA hydratase-related protein [Candidatus Thermoplasmatota archaeon]
MIDVSREGKTVILTINNPPMNVLNSELLKELDCVLDEISNDDSLVVIITGAGRAFVAGADIKEMMNMDPEEARRFAGIGQSVFNKIEHLPKPVIAAINGFALGGGTELAMSCDIIFASEKAKFGQPEVALAVIPGFGGTQRLPRMVGRNIAKELIFSGNIIGADEAYRIGLANRLLPHEELMDAAKKLADTISKKGPAAVRLAKKAINGGLDMTLSDGLDFEAEKFSDLFDTHDQKEGMDAFVNKRKPDFRGE